MTVITSKDDDFLCTSESKCTICKAPLTRYPILYWNAYESPLLLCADCCASMNRGFIADMIRINAIRDMREFGQFTLIRPPYKVWETGETTKPGRDWEKEMDEYLAGENARSQEPPGRPVE
jgi:hypothetical protein